ncbi:hypothetical protein RN001_008704 [Aquatica leii]|uniref:Uncharacterized protein n=1 Tax=Aquatica leii TaxID=1421715 RepID=A0AAN7SPC4_9COLE|nr:hypothetical protein RN001_008704 [Aquatica leii]
MSLRSRRILNLALTNKENEMEFTSSDSEIISETEYEASEHELDDTEGDSEGDVEIPFVTPIEINLDNNELHQAIPTGYYSKKCLRRHVKKCFFNPDPSKPIKSQIEGQNIMIGAFGPNDPLKISGLLDKLRADKISLTAKRDKIICEVARRYLKSHKEKHLVTVAKRYMRRLARILEQVRQYEGNSKLSLEEILKPSQFKNLIQATKSVSGYETESDTYKSPSFALQTGTLLKRAIQAALSIEIQRDNPSNEKRTELNNLIHLIETDWAYEISTQAVQNLAINRFNKPTLIPLTKDIKKFDTYLRDVMRNTVEKIKDNREDSQSFKILMEVVFCSLMIFNKRRVGELQRMTLDAYLKSYENISSSEFEKALTNSEKIMYRQLKRVVIRETKSGKKIIKSESSEEDNVETMEDQEVTSFKISKPVEIEKYVDLDNNIDSKEGRKNVKKKKKLSCSGVI